MASKIVGRVKDNIQAKLPTVYGEKKCNYGRYMCKFMFHVS